MLSSPSSAFNIAVRMWCWEYRAKESVLVQINQAFTGAGRKIKCFELVAWLALKRWMRDCQSVFFFPRKLSHQLKHYCFLMQSLVRMLTCFGLYLDSDWRTGAHGRLIPHSSLVFCAALSRVDQLLSTIMFKVNISWVFLFYINKSPQWWLSCGLVEEPGVSLHRVIKRS